MRITNYGEMHCGTVAILNFRQKAVEIGHFSVSFISVDTVF